MRMEAELEDMAMEYERTHAAAIITEKRGKNFDKVLGEWQSKAADVSAEVAASQDEGRNYTSELFRLKAAQDEGLEQLDIVKRENKVRIYKLFFYQNELSDKNICRTSPMRSRTFWISLVRADAPCTSWTNLAGSWRLRRRSCRTAWKR